MSGMTTPGVTEVTPKQVRDLGIDMSKLTPVGEATTVKVPIPEITEEDKASWLSEINNPDISQIVKNNSSTKPFIKPEETKPMDNAGQIPKVETFPSLNLSGSEQKLEQSSAATTTSLNLKAAESVISNIEPKSENDEQLPEIENQPTISAKEDAKVESTDDGLTENQRMALAIETVLKFNDLRCPKFGNLKFLPLPIDIGAGKQTFIGFTEEGKFIQLEEKISTAKEIINKRIKMSTKDLEEFHPQEPEGYSDNDRDHIIFVDGTVIPVKFSSASPENIDQALKTNIEARKDEKTETERLKKIGLVLTKYAPTINA
jgi:hypothetical protein